MQYARKCRKDRHLFELRSICARHEVSRLHVHKVKMHLIGSMTSVLVETVVSPTVTTTLADTTTSDDAPVCLKRHAFAGVPSVCAERKGRTRQEKQTAMHVTAWSNCSPGFAHMLARCEERPDTAHRCMCACVYTCMYIYIYVLRQKNPTLKLPLALFRLRYDSTPTKSLASHNRSNQDNDRPYCLFSLVNDDEILLKPTS